MINQLLKLGALIATGRFLKPRLKGLLILLVVWVTLWFLHSEYVSYVELSDDRRWVLQASILKLVLYVFSVACYVLLVERPLWPKVVAVTEPSHKQAPSQPAKPGNVNPGETQTDDGFDFLRRKRKLKGSTEKLLNK